MAHPEVDGFIADYLRLRDDVLTLFDGRGMLQSWSWDVTTYNRPMLRLTFRLTADLDAVFKHHQDVLRERGFNAFREERTLFVQLPMDSQPPTVLHMGYDVPLASITRVQIEYGALGFVDLTGTQARDAIVAIQHGRRIPTMHGGS